MKDYFMKSPLLLLLSLVIPNCQVTPPAAIHPVTINPIKNRPLSVDGIVELY